jgi:hypothetical protein
VKLGMLAKENVEKYGVNNDKSESNRVAKISSPAAISMA